MIDIKAEFTKFCGPSVLYTSHSKEGHTLKIWYSIPAIERTGLHITGYVSNGLEVTLRRAVRRAADSARSHAYIATGHRDADMKHLLQGKTL